MASTASMPVYMMPSVPVMQPSHLEGDASLATEILPGPPSLVSVQQSALKRDPRKPSSVPSYLPPVDPGSTYSALMAGNPVAGSLEVGGPRTKRPRVDKGGATGRAQRANARNQNGLLSAPNPPADNETLAGSEHAAITHDSDVTMLVEDEPSISRSNSLSNLQEGTTQAANGRSKLKREKGKARELEPSVVKIKEEPKTIALLTPEPPLPFINNDDHCSSCRSQGALVYCDGCPRAFHLWCLDPPMESVDEGDSRWFCPACVIRKHPPRRPPPCLLSPLIHQVTTSIPTEFQLPDHIRNYFKDVTTGPKGTYVDSTEIKQPRLNRHGQLEDRDPYRLRDRNGAPVLCFRCGKSALPVGVTASAPVIRTSRETLTDPSSDTWKSIVSCDYCSLHWHLDCLDPPLANMPSFGKKWMCPNHSEQVVPVKRRIPKHNAVPIDIAKPDQRNNGHIEIINSEMTSTNQSQIAVDEVLINGRRYRVPERIVVLDFWSKISRTAKAKDKSSNAGSGLSSPLTSLSSLDDDFEDQRRSVAESTIYTSEDLKIAQMLCGLRMPSCRDSQITPDNPSRKYANIGVQTKTDVRTEPASLPSPAKASSTRKSSLSTKQAPTNGTLVNGVASIELSKQVSASAGPSRPPIRRRKSMSETQAEASTRELRSRNKKDDSSLASISSKTSEDVTAQKANISSNKGKPVSATEYLKEMLPIRQILPPPRRVKVEESDDIPPPLNGSTTEPAVAPKTNPKKRPCTSRRASHKESESASTVQGKDKRGRKRKERDEEIIGSTENAPLPELNKERKEKKGKEPEKEISTTERVTEVPGSQSSVSKERKGKKRRNKTKEATEEDEEETAMQTESDDSKRSWRFDPPKGVRRIVGVTVPNFPIPRSRLKSSETSLTSLGPQKPPGPPTPSLKIRLPRLSNVTSQPHASPQRPSINTDTPTRL